MNTSTIRAACVLLFAVCTAMPARAAAGSAAPTPLPALQAAGVPFDLGAVIDFRRVGVQGVTVLAITPGGAAERLGLLAGDRIVSANGRQLSTGNRPSAALASALAASSERLQLDIVRDGRTLSLSGPVAPVVAEQDPASAGCGVVTSQGSHPRASANIFPVSIVSIDARNVLPQPGGYHQLPAGRHVLVLREMIDGYRFGTFAGQERKRQRERHGPRRDKVLVVDVRPDTIYSIGARQTRRPLDVEDVRDNSYWEPVVWRSVAGECR